MNRAVLLSALLLAAMPASVWAQVAAGSEFRVNSYTTGNQYVPAVASDSSGNFVVIWNSLGQDGSGTGVFGQRFNASGVPQGGEFRVNTYTTGYQRVTAVAADSDGDFVVVWDSPGQDGSSVGIFGQRLNASGTPQGSEFQVNTYTTGSEGGAAVASDASGSFVVVWTSPGQDGASYGVFGRRFDASGVPQGSDFQVNTYTTDRQYDPAVVSDASGNFVVVWTSTGQDGSYEGIFGRRFNASGVPQGSEFQVDTYFGNRQYRPAVAMDPAGDFVVVWQSQGGRDGSGLGIFAQRYQTNGVAAGPEFQVNGYTTGNQFEPSVAMDATGNFVVTWQSGTQDGGGYGVFGQRYDASAVPLGGEFRVNSFTTSSQVRPAIARAPDGDFVVVWGSSGQDGGLYGVFGQRYGDLIFEDGFDSTDLSRWSSTSTDGADLSVSGAAAMAATTAGLQAFVNDTNPLFVQDDTPNAENRYRARFYCDTNGFDPGEASFHFRTRIFIAFDDAGLRVITLVLKRQSGAYSLEGRVRLNDGTRADTGFFPITDGPHFFELDWIRSAGPGVGNGLFTMRIDGAIASTLSDLNNDVSPVDFVRMGALSLKTGAAGTLFFDQFESRRQRLIGSE